ncbi:MAG TPA: hypothetical protein VF989_06715 [Polyangiaceae bacterium]
MVEAMLVLAAAVAFFLWSSRRQRGYHERQRRKERTDQVLEDASVIVVDLSARSESSAWREAWTFDFASMSLEHEKGFLDFPMRPDVTYYVMRRRGPGDWQMKQTPASATAERERLERDVESFEADEIEQVRKHIGESLKWHDLPTEILSEAERGYQRFARARREAEAFGP